ncbi:MAG TPA: hypothetical protein VI814_13375 [Candidatus Limnocylindria bacterium]
MKRIGTAALALLLGAACGSTTAAPSSATPTISHAPTAERLVVEGDDATTAIDVATRKTVARLPGGVLSPSGDLIVRANGAAGTKKTVVQGWSLAGDTVFGLALGDDYSFPNAYGAAPSGFSPNGKWLVLVARDSKESRFAVIDVANKKVARTLALSSRFTFDAIHDDGNGMYLIEHPTASSTAYNVRFYDLQAGVLRPDIIFDKTQIAQYDPTVGLMDGTFHVSVMPKKGDWTYGLYMRPNGAPFVHALNVPGRYAQCIVDLAGTWTAASMFSMALTDDGRALYVVDTAGGTVSVIDALAQKVVRRATFATRSTVGDPRSATMVIAHDGSRLYASAATGIAMLQTSDLSLRGWLAPDIAARSLAISSDNARLYALAGDAVVVIDIASGRVVAKLADAPGARSVHVLAANDVSRR